MPDSASGWVPTKVALIDGATVHRRGRTDQGEVLAKRRQQGVGDGAYVARRRAVEGGQYF